MVWQNQYFIQDSNQYANNYLISKLLDSKPLNWVKQVGKIFLFMIAE